MEDKIEAWGWRISRQKLTQSEFCEKVGVKHNTFRSAIWAGKTSTETLNKIENGLKELENAD